MNINVPKLLLFDLDGTLVRSNHSIDPRVIEALHTVQARGVQVGFATGRAFFGAQRIIEPLKAQGPSMFFSGALVANPATGEVIFAEPMDPAEVEAIVRDARSQEIYTELYTQDRYFIDQEGPLTQLHMEYMGERPVVGDLIDVAKTSAILKIVMIGAAGETEPRIRNLAEHYKEQVPCGMTTGAAHPGVLFANFTSKRASREFALEAILTKSGLKAEDIASFGDAPADLEFIERVGFGVAMGNASEEVRSRASIVAADVNEDGILPVLAAFFPECSII